MLTFEYRIEIERKPYFTIETTQRFAPSIDRSLAERDDGSAQKTRHAPLNQSRTWCTRIQKRSKLELDQRKRDVLLEGTGGRRPQQRGSPSHKVECLPVFDCCRGRSLCGDATTGKLRLSSQPLHEPVVADRQSWTRGSREYSGPRFAGWASGPH